MTEPTKSIVQQMFDDVRKMSVEMDAKSYILTQKSIKDCIKKITVIKLHESIMVDNELEIKAYYAGHVLGAAMFRIKVGSQSVVYTGDFNMSPDRHLGPASIDKCQPDLLITESTNVGIARTSTRCRDRDFLRKVHDCLSAGGNVLIPAFILGRAQQLCLLLDAYWNRMNLKYPIYCCLGPTKKVIAYYKMFINWTNPKLSEHFNNPNLFELKNIKLFEKEYIYSPGPKVIIAAPGMLLPGLSLQIFKEWAPYEKNILIMPDHCQNGTVGYKVLEGEKRIVFENKQVIEVKMSVEFINFNAISDGNGVLQLIRKCEPKNIVLVTLKNEVVPQQLSFKIRNNHKIGCYTLTRGETCTVTTLPKIPSDVAMYLSKDLQQNFHLKLPSRNRQNLFYAILVVEGDRIVNMNLFERFRKILMDLPEKRYAITVTFHDEGSKARAIEILYEILKIKLRNWEITLDDNCTMKVESLIVKLDTDKTDQAKKLVEVSWLNKDEDIASYIFNLFQKMR